MSEEILLRSSGSSENSVPVAGGRWRSLALGVVGGYCSTGAGWATLAIAALFFLGRGGWGSSAGVAPLLPSDFPDQSVAQQEEKI